MMLRTVAVSHIRIAVHTMVKTAAIAGKIPTSAPTTVPMDKASTTCFIGSFIDDVR